jgi:hypothetical protein
MSFTPIQSDGSVEGRTPTVAKVARPVWSVGLLPGSPAAAFALSRLTESSMTKQFIQSIDNDRET